MSEDSSSEQRLQLAPGAQAVEVDAGRLLVRHPRGLSLLGNVDPELVQQIFELCREPWSSTDLLHALGAAKAKEARPVLRQLLGAGLQLVEAQTKAPAEPLTLPIAVRREAPRTADSQTLERRVAIVGEGPAARILASLLDARGVSIRSLAGPRSARDDGLEAVGLDDPGPEATDLDGTDLVIALLEDRPYSDLFALQRACLRRSVPSLFATFDSDGVHVGPANLGTAPPCLACARLAGLESLGIDERMLLAALGRFRTRPWRQEQSGEIQELSRRTLELLAGQGAGVIGHLLQIREGRRLPRPLPRPQGCPLCQNAFAPASDARTAGRALSSGGAIGARAAATRLVAIDDFEHSSSRAGRDGGPRRVCILGGGTAGYLTALALRRRLPQVEVTVLESSRLGVIGVGEATTPLMPQFLHLDLGFDVRDFFHRVGPTLKLGIGFAWGGGREPDFNYPFGALRLLEAQSFDGHVGNCSLRSMLMARGAVPLFEHSGRCLSRLDTEVAYHLDNRSLVAYLGSEARKRGVRVIDTRVIGAGRQGAGVGELVAEDGRRFDHDLYVDCSGFRSLLMGETLEDPFVGFEASLFTDRAIVAEVPHGGRVEPFTLAEAMDAGWCWSTPQRETDHRGYVYSSAFAGDQEALDEMARLNPGLGEPRTLRFRPGRRRSFWRGNVFALGNAYGFVEPLESTALHMLIRQIAMLIEAYPWHEEGESERGLRTLLNRRVASQWDYLRWFLALHFKFNRRLDTPFWRTCRESVDVSAHAELLEIFAHRGPLSSDPAASRSFDYPDPLWGPEGIDLILLGQEVPTSLPRPRWSEAAWQSHLQRCRLAADRALPQGQALELLDERPELLQAFVSALRAAGPVTG